MRGAGEPVPIVFTQSLYDTERYTSIPLTFFFTKDLRVLLDESTILPTTKANPLSGEGTRVYILDIDRLLARFGDELSLTCSQWTEATANMWQFQVTRDKISSEGKHAKQFENHFSFFNRLEERDELYEAWKVMELEFRQNHRRRNWVFSAADYGIAAPSSRICIQKEIDIQGPGGDAQFNKQFPQSQHAKVLITVVKLVRYDRSGVLMLDSKERASYVPLLLSAFVGGGGNGTE